jgi:hypothetical protein
MRTFLALTLFAAACTNSGVGGDGSYDSVRDRLSDGPTRLSIGSTESSGSITARRWSTSGWLEGVSAVTIDSGVVSASVDARGALNVDKLEVYLGSIPLPDDVFKKPAQLDDVQMRLLNAASAEAQWASADDATAQLTLDLAFDWSIQIDGKKTPLGRQKLPPVVIDLALTGGGDHIDASVTLDANGQLWNWADLIQMTSLELTLAAATVD